MRKIHPSLETYPIFEGNDQFPHCLEGLIVPVGGDKLIATFTMGGTFEPSEENFTAIARSDDGGCTWSKAVPLFAHSSKGLFTSTIYKQGDVIRAHLNTYRTDTNWAEDVQSYYSESYDDGRTFTTPRSLPGCINNVHIKQAVKIGDKLLLPFSWREIDGEAWCHPVLEKGNKVAMVNGIPSPQMTIASDALPAQRYKEGYFRWALENTSEYIGVLISEDGGKTYRVCGRISGEGYGKVLCEPTLAVLRDGTLMMYIRCNSLKTLFETRSTDGGESWTPIKPLDLPTPITKVRLYTRKNGDLLLLHNPNNERRSPLSLWISHDDGKTWSEKVDLVTDDERPLAYPDGYVDEENNCLCFAWEDRHNVYFSRWPL